MPDLELDLQPPDVMGVADVARELGITPAGVRWMRAENRLPPYTRLETASRDVWDGPTIRALAADRDRRDPRHSTILRAYRQHGSITRAATTAGVSRSTATRVLERVGILERRSTP